MAGGYFNKWSPMLLHSIQFKFKFNKVDYSTQNYTTVVQMTNIDMFTQNNDNIM